MAKFVEDCGGIKPIPVKRSAAADKRFEQKQKNSTKKNVKKK